MKKIAIVLLSMCTLSAAYCRAESFTHIFDEMARGGGTLTFPYRASSDYTVGETDKVTYTCSDGGSFGFNGMAYCIVLPNGGIVQTSPAVENLTRLVVTHTSSAAPIDVQILISSDNSTWTDITSSDMFVPYGINAPMPAKGNYYLKIVNSGSEVKFLKFQYAYDPCHCLRVVSE